MDLMQKAKIKWAIERDENSKYFHAIINNKFSRFRINEIYIDGVWVTNPPQVTDSIFNFHKVKFQVVHSVVSEVQTAYIRGRQIIDGPLMVNEIISWATKHKERFFLLKVDFEKAFDSIDWNFLDHTMMQMGFSHKWRTWIKGCLNSAYASVLVNGSLTKEFKIERGLRQVDPLSLFLFIIAIEALRVNLQEAKSKNIFEGIKVGSNKVDISQLQYADDALIMGKWTLENATNLCCILRCFHLASRLKVNFSKSKFFGIGVTTTESHHMTSILCCQPSTLPCSFHGLPIGANMNKASFRKPIGNGYHQKDKIQAKPDKTKHETKSTEKSKVNQINKKSTPTKSKPPSHKKYNFRG
nr:putative RNA-directed DNA polymerase, eukaryota, reverse transcriptase zinc-binding domain protein [Tanacetum cinerariifolium]GEV47287.1 putative RNA-directed DNA polymerase, eukaryota, reverse transcriptase zinc-binding domain protein [Tanacetum cinerariifolium]